MARTLKVLAVCGLGMGSSLILHMTTDEALARLGVDAEVDHTDVSSARSMTADVMVGQGMVVDDLAGLAPVIISIDDFVDVDALVEKLRPELAAQGWL